MSLSGSFQPHPKCKYIHVLHIFTQRLPLLIIDKEERRDSFKLERMSFTGIYLPYEKKEKRKIPSFTVNDIFKNIFEI